MKKILIILFAASIVVACTKEPKIDYVLISGKIDNPAAKTVSINGYDFEKTINLDDNDAFTDTLKIISNGYHTIKHGEQVSQMYLNTGDDLHIKFNTKEYDETTVYTGVGAKANNYLVAKNLYLKKNKPDFLSMEEADFLKEVQKLKTNSEAFLNKAEGLSESFRALEEKSNHYNYLGKLQQYKSFRRFFEKYKTSEKFNTIQQLALKQITYTNDYDYNSFQLYKKIVDNYYLNKFDNTEDLSLYITQVKSIPSVNIKNTIAEKLIENIRPGNVKNETFFNELMQISTGEKLKNQLKAAYQKVLPLAKGMPSPVFVNYENHKGGKTSLEDFRGKYVYIDIWATWCQPCKQEIPFLKKVESKYHNKNIEFVSISVDKDKKGYDAWVKMVNDKELGGIQLIADDSSNSDFIKKYLSYGIPRFILIDPEGNIVSADAPRPSNPKLIELFNELKI